ASVPRFAVLARASRATAGWDGAPAGRAGRAAEERGTSASRQVCRWFRDSGPRGSTRRVSCRASNSHAPPRDRQHDRFPMGSKLYVGNLSYTTTEDSLRAAFSANGRTVKEVAIPNDRDTG